MTAERAGTALPRNRLCERIGNMTMNKEMLLSGRGCRLSLLLGLLPLLSGCFSMPPPAKPPSRYAVEPSAALWQPSASAATADAAGGATPVSIGRIRGSKEAEDRTIFWVDTESARTGRVRDAQFLLPPAEIIRAALRTSLGGSPKGLVVLDHTVAPASRASGGVSVEGWIEHFRLLRTGDEWSAQIEGTLLLSRGAKTAPETLPLQCTVPVLREAAAPAGSVPKPAEIVEAFRRGVEAVTLQVEKAL